MGFDRRALLAGGVAALGLRPGVVMAAATVQVVIDDYAFVPAALRIPVGTMVTWENRDGSPHNVVSSVNPRTFRSRTMATGEKFEFTFATVGTHRYFCGLHPHMQGVVIVE